MNKYPQAKIWHVGGEDVRMRIPLLKALKIRGFSVGAIGTEDAKIFEENDIPYKKYSLYRWVGPFSDFQSYRQLRSIFSELRPDIVHGFDTKPAILTPIAGNKLEGLQSLRTVTGMGYVFSSNSISAKIIKPFYRFFQKIASQRASKTIFQNPDDKKYFEDTALIAKNKSLMVRGSGIDISEFLNKQVSEDEIADLKATLCIENKLVVIMVARLVKDKGVLEFLEASRIVKSQQNNVEFLLVGPITGEGTEAIGLNTINKYMNTVNYLGKRTDIAALLHISDVFVLPSYYREGLPRVLLEAGVANLPLITTDMPGCKEVVIPDWNGWLVKPRSISDLAEKINQAVTIDENERELMGKRSSQLVQTEFNLDKVADEYAAIYKSILGQNYE